MHLFGCGVFLALVHWLVFSVSGSSVVSEQVLQPMLQIFTVQILCLLILLFKLTNAVRAWRGMEPFVVAGYGTVEDKAAKLAIGMSYVLWGVAVVASFSSLYFGAKFAIAAAYFWGIAEVCLNPLRPSEQSRLWAPALGFVIAVPFVY